MKNNRVFPRVWTTQVTKTADCGDLIFSVRAPVGEVGKTDYNVVIGRGVASIKGNDFIYQSLIRMNLNGFWKSFSSGSTFESINSSDLKNATLFIPREKEQLLLGSFFNQVDNLITLHQRESFLNIQIISPESERITISTSLFSSSWMICKYVFCVVVILECPNLRATLAIDTPANNNSEA